MKTKITPLERAIVIVGSQEKLANLIGKRQSHVSYWLNDSKEGVPAKQAIAIEEATGGLVTRRDLRPDIWPVPAE